MKLALVIGIAVALSSCSVEYDSPRTGFRYKVDVPFSAVAPYIPVKPSVIQTPTVSPQK